MNWRLSKEICFPLLSSYCLIKVKVVILFHKCISSLIILIVFYFYISYETLSAFQYNETLQYIYKDKTFQHNETFDEMIKRL